MSEVDIIYMTKKALILTVFAIYILPIDLFIERINSLYIELNKKSLQQTPTEF